MKSDSVIGITLTAGGSQIKIGQNGIEIISPSPIQYKGAQHVFGGGASVNSQLPNLPTSYAGHFQATDEVSGAVLAGVQYLMTLPNGQKILGQTDTEGKSIHAYTDIPKPIDLQILEDEPWYQPESMVDYKFSMPFVEDFDNGINDSDTEK
jgi:type VI secretion system secreted protein VgrG